MLSSFLHAVTSADGDIRLVGDERNGYGAVQLKDFNPIVGFVGICPDDGSFGETEAGVVCRQLGYDSGTPTDLRFALLTHVHVCMFIVHS